MVIGAAMDLLTEEVVTGAAYEVVVVGAAYEVVVVVGAAYEVWTGAAYEVVTGAAVLTTLDLLTGLTTSVVVTGADST